MISLIHVIVCFFGVGGGGGGGRWEEGGMHNILTAYTI